MQLLQRMGHLHATRQGIKSTKKIPVPILPSESCSDDSSESNSEPPEQRIWCRVHHVRGRAHSDATGALPVRGRSEAQYQIVFFHKDSNFIHIEISKSRKEPDLPAALQRAIKFFVDRGAPPLIIRVDNECAKDTKRMSPIHSSLSAWEALCG